MNVIFGEDENYFREIKNVRKFARVFVTDSRWIRSDFEWKFSLVLQQIWVVIYRCKNNIFVWKISNGFKYLQKLEIEVFGLTTFHAFGHMWHSLRFINKRGWLTLFLFVFSWTQTASKIIIFFENRFAFWQNGIFHFQNRITFRPDVSLSDLKMMRILK